MTELKSQIQSKIMFLSRDWFQSKMKSFVNESFYNPTIKKIYAVIPKTDYFQSQEGNCEEIIESEIIIDLDINKYCWESYHYGGRLFEISENDLNDDNYPKDSYLIAHQIESLIVDSIKDFSDVQAIHNFINNTIVVIRKTINELKSNEFESEYVMMLTDFQVKLQNSILKRFGYIQTQIDYSSDYTDKLEFNLSQEQLSALLLIINKAGFLNTSDYTDNRFLTFCQKYFYFKYKKAYKRIETFKTFRNKYYEHINGKSPVAFNDIVNKLKEILNN